MGVIEAGSKDQMNVDVCLTVGRPNHSLCVRSCIKKENYAAHVSEESFGVVHP